MRFLDRSVYVGLVTLTALGALGFAPSCAADESDRKRAANLAEKCSINSDCSAPLICAFGRCHEECSETRDCAAGSLCVPSETGLHVCQLQAEKACADGAQCAASQICAVDGVCRPKCKTELDCIGAQLCVSGGVCANPEELTDAGVLPGTPDAGTGGAGGSGTGAVSGSGATGGAGATGGTGTGATGGTGTGGGGGVVDAGQTPTLYWQAPSDGKTIRRALVAGSSVIVLRSTDFPQGCVIEQVTGADASAPVASPDAGTCLGMTEADASVYFGTQGVPGDVAPTIRAVPVGGGTPTAFVSALNRASTLFSNGFYWVWSDDKAIVFTNKPKESTLMASSPELHLLAIEPTHAWYVDDLSGSWRLYRREIKYAAIATKMADGATTEDQGAAEKDTFYWARQDTGASDGKIARLKVGASPTETVLQKGVKPTNVVIDASNVYFGTRAPDFSVFKVPKNGGTVTALGNATAEPWLVGTDATHLYYLEADGQSILRLPK